MANGIIIKWGLTVILYKHVHKKKWNSNFYGSILLHCSEQPRYIPVSFSFHWIISYWSPQPRYYQPLYAVTVLLCYVNNPTEITGWNEGWFCHYALLCSYTLFLKIYLWDSKHLTTPWYIANNFLRNTFLALGQPVENTVTNTPGHLYSTVCTTDLDSWIKSSTLGKMQHIPQKTQVFSGVHM